MYTSRIYTVNKRRHFRWFCEVTKPRKVNRSLGTKLSQIFHVNYNGTVGWFTVIGYGRIYEIKKEIVNTYCFKIFLRSC